RWFEKVLARAALGPTKLAPYERGQIVHILSTGQGARHVASAHNPLKAEWLLVADRLQRYATPRQFHTRGEEVSSFDPFEALRLDDDPRPSPVDQEDILRSREVPEELSDLFRSSTFDQEHGSRGTGTAVRGSPSQFNAELPPR